MAPRKRTTTLIDGTAKALAPKPTGVTKKAASAIPLRRSARVLKQTASDVPLGSSAADVNDSSEDETLVEGLIDLNKTPEHLIATANHNATQSPLLRLPAELRNQIWHLVLCGEYIKVPLPKTSRYYRPYAREYWSLNNNAEQNLFVYNISSVSRQVYAETALLPYKFNTFIFGENFSRTHAIWPKSLLPAYRNAITTVAVTKLSGNTLGLYKGSGNDRRKRLPTHFSNLKTIEITTFEVRMACFSLRRDYTAGTQQETQQEKNRWATMHLKKKHGAHLDVVVLGDDETKELDRIYGDRVTGL